MQQYAPQDGFGCSREAYRMLEEWLDGPEAAVLGHAGLEEELAARGRELQRLMLQEHLDARAAREARRAGVAGPDGITRTRAERGHSRQLSTVFGPVTVTRIAYRAPGAANVHVADAELSLPPGRHSHGLALMAAVAAAGASFGRAAAAVAAATGSRLGRRQCEELTRQAAADFEAFWACQIFCVCRGLVC